MFQNHLAFMSRFKKALLINFNDVPKKLKERLFLKKIAIKSSHIPTLFQFCSQKSRVRRIYISFHELSFVKENI